MQVETEQLITITNFANQKGLARQHVYRLIESGDINSVVIDGINFVLLDDKSEILQRKRKEKGYKDKGE
jgi:hypothetical protein